MRRILVVFWMMICMFATPALAAAQDIVELNEERDPLIRVQLTKLALTDRLDVTLTAPYVLKDASGRANTYFQSGSELSFQLRNGVVYLYYQGMTQEIGKEVCLEKANSQEKTGWIRTNFPALYMGDLRLTAEGEKLIPILTIHVEDYLLGVVPYEMSNAFPLEALKAQAVAARTYALRNQNSNAAYDVVDNTNDQVFYGYVKGNERAEQAVRETRGICGFDQGRLAQCYYAASNGGQMELPQTVWPSRENLSCYAFGEDPYDFENPESTVRKIALRKKYTNEAAPYGLRVLIAEMLSEKLEMLGYDPAPESIRVDEILHAVTDTPETLNSRKMTMLRLALRISGRTRSDVVIAVSDPDTEEVSLFQTDTTKQIKATAMDIEQTFAPVVTTAPTATPQPVYGPFVPIDEEISLDIPIFPNAEEAFGMDILPHYNNELWSVTETNEMFSIEARRYGHGVGMSQRGAQQMAEAYNKTYQEILAFYYPGMQLGRYAQREVPIPAVDQSLSSTAGPAPSPTPRPTLMPVTMEAGKDQYFATVTGIAEDSSLNLRAEPSLNGKILMRLYKGQRLLVVEECPQEGWVKVETDAAAGYVSQSYLSIEK